MVAGFRYRGPVTLGGLNQRSFRVRGQCLAPSRATGAVPHATPLNEMNRPLMWEPLEHLFCRQKSCFRFLAIFHATMAPQVNVACRSNSKKAKASSWGCRIIGERLRSAVEDLRGGGPEPDEAIAQRRKRLERGTGGPAAAVPALSGDLYERERTGYRDAARPLSPVRDTRVLLDALQRLDSNGERSSLDLERLHHRIESRGSSCITSWGPRGGSRSCRKHWHAQARRVEEWQPSRRGGRMLAPALRRTYRGGRKLMRRLADRDSDQSERTDLRLHEWRKRSKVLWYQLEVLENVWPAMMEPFARQVHRLTDLLGEDHDLAVLRDLVRADGEAEMPAESRAAVLEKIDALRRNAQEQAFPLGRRIYAEKPGAFARRMKGYWRTWKKSARVELATRLRNATPRLAASPH